VCSGCDGGTGWCVLSKAHGADDLPTNGSPHHARARTARCCPHHFHGQSRAATAEATTVSRVRPRALPCQPIPSYHAFDDADWQRLRRYTPDMPLRMLGYTRSAVLSSTPLRRLCSSVDHSSSISALSALRLAGRLDLLHPSASARRWVVLSPQAARRPAAVKMNHFLWRAMRATLRRLKVTSFDRCLYAV
jgi:hypothetical protein